MALYLLLPVAMASNLIRDFGTCIRIFSMINYRGKKIRKNKNKNSKNYGNLCKLTNVYYFEPFKLVKIEKKNKLKKKNSTVNNEREKNELFLQAMVDNL